MAAPLDEYEKEAGCVPILHPEEIKSQSHYNHGYSDSFGRKSHIDDYSTWDIVKATQKGDAVKILTKKQLRVPIHTDFPSPEPQLEMILQEEKEL